MKPRKMLSLLLAALLAAMMIPAAFAADDAGTPPADGTPTLDGALDDTPDEALDEASDETSGEAPDEASDETSGEALDGMPSGGQVVVPVIEKKTAVLSKSSVLVDGAPVAFDAYTIDGFNYFKLRDIAAAVTGTNAAFNVAWNAEAFCIELTGGANYEKAEGDLVAGVGAAQVTASSTSMAILLNGESVALSGYIIDGNTFFQLRDLGEKLGFTVSWDGDANAIVIETAAAPAGTEAAEDTESAEADAEGTEGAEAENADGADGADAAEGAEGSEAGDAA